MTFEHHLLPAFGSRLLREISVHDVADLLDALRKQGRAESTIAGLHASASSGFVRSSRATRNSSSVS